MEEPDRRILADDDALRFAARWRVDGGERLGRLRAIEVEPEALARPSPGRDRPRAGRDRLRERVDVDRRVVVGEEREHVVHAVVAGREAEPLRREGPDAVRVPRVNARPECVRAKDGERREGRDLGVGLRVAEGPLRVGRGRAPEVGARQLVVGAVEERVVLRVGLVGHPGLRLRRARVGVELGDVPVVADDGRGGVPHVDVAAGGGRRVKAPVEQRGKAGRGDGVLRRVVVPRRTLLGHPAEVARCEPEELHAVSPPRGRGCLGSARPSLWWSAP